VLNLVEVSQSVLFLSFGMSVLFGLSLNILLGFFTNILIFRPISPLKSISEKKIKKI
jgi:hypothetical protein